MDDLEIRKKFQDALGRSISLDRGRLKEHYNRATIYYNAEAKGDLAPPALAGKASIVATDTRDTIEWAVPSLIRMFTQGASLAEVTAKQEEAQDYTEVVEAYLNKVVYEDNNGYDFFQDSFKDALLFKAGFVKVWIEEETEKKSKTYNPKDELELQYLLESGNPSEYSDGDDGMSLTMTEDKVEKRIKIATVNANDVFLSASTVDIECTDFVAHRFYATRAELKSRGYKVPESLGGAGYGQRYDVFNDENASISSWNNPDDIECYEAYFRGMGDDVDDYTMVVLANDTVIHTEKVENHPIFSFVPIRKPHQFFGTSLAELSFQATQQKTMLMRNALDFVAIQTVGRAWGVDNNVNMKDLLAMGRPGAVVRMQAPGMAGAFDTGGDISSALGLMTAVDHDKQQSTGITDMTAGGDAPLSLNTATGVSIITNRADVRIELIARNFANSLTQVLRRILKLASEHITDPIKLYVNNTYMNTTPQGWDEYFSVRCNVGLGANNQQTMLQNLTALADAMTRADAAGIVTPDNVYNASLDFVRALGFTSPERYFTKIDPNAPQPVDQEKQMMQIQLQQAQLDQQQLKLENDALTLQLINKEREQEISKQKLELQERELEVKQVQMAASIQAKQQEINLKEAQYLGTVPEGIHVSN